MRSTGTTRRSGCTPWSSFATSTACSPAAAPTPRSCDLDHLVPYAEHGPPGQTHPANLAPLCRRHHNRKTHHGWRYDRTAAGYAWTSPLRPLQYLVPHLT